jgi:lipoprotein-anchoring transpeptidase ErfK/SrfK
MRTRSRRFGLIQKIPVATARLFTCAAESANQRSNLGFDPVSPVDGARMTVRVGLLLRLALGGALAALGCAGAGAATPGQDEMNVVDQPGYQPTPEEQELTGAYEKQEVFFRTTEAPGTIIIDTKGRFLYLVQGNNRALRYGIGVGREGFTWSGLQKIARKQEWPDWRPPPEMIERQPYLPRFMAGGPGNPLGARAMYLGGTVYRIHGTNQPQTIGHAVSSGCFRLVNDDVIDLYDRVPVGTKVIIRQAVAL